MKKNFFYLFALICSMSLFTACSDDDDPVYPIEEELAGTYKGELGISVNNTSLGPGIVQKVYISKSASGNNQVKLELKNFSFGDFNLGDIQVDPCAVKEQNGTYTFIGSQTLNLAAPIGSCPVTVSGTIKGSNISINIGVTVTALQQEVVAKFDGSKMTGNESKEAKITDFTIDNAFVTEQPIIDEASGKITFKVNDTATDDDLKALKPVFKISDKATVTPASGVAQDFSDGKTVTYTVISEDGTIKTYVVSIAGSQNFLKYSFDTWVVQKEGLKNEYWNPDPINELSTSNDGAGLLVVLGYKGGFPVVEEKEGYSGSAAKLITLYTKGAGFGMAPAITSGSLFTGAFVTDSQDQLNSTKFGIPYGKKPLTFKGVYKYTPGDNYVDGSDKKNVQENLDIVDECSIMAVLYEAVDAKEQEVILTGHDIASSEYRVAVAVLADGSAKEDWTPFELPFMELEGKSYDASKSYKLAIVCSSSKDGAAFKGAVNSTLIIDDFEVVGE